MSVVFRGRLRPNIQRNPTEPLTVQFTRPTTADGVTLLIKELDTYRDPQNRQISEGSDDDLLATFTGRIRNRRFQVESHRNESADSSLPTIKIKFQGSETEYTIPVVSETGEAEGTNWEIGFTVQHSGNEYNSPVAFIPAARGRLLVVDDTMGDLTMYQSHANRTHHAFTSNGMEGRIIRGARSDTSVSHYSAADTTDYVDGYDYQTFLDITGDFDFVYFNCHGDINLVGYAYGQKSSPCMLCEHRFSHRSFTTCTRNTACVRTQHRGYYQYRLRTANNVEIDLSGSAATEVLQLFVGDSDLKQLVHTYVGWNDYEPAFASANTGNPNVTVSSGTTYSIDGISVPGPDELNITIPNRFNFPTITAFPTGPLRPDFRQDHLPQDPPSPYLHHSSAQDVPGVPVICFKGRGSPLSAEVNATPTVGAGSPPTAMTFPPSTVTTQFEEQPTGLTATPYNGQVHLTWNEVVGAETYTLYWSNSAGVQESNSQLISDLSFNEHTHTGLTNGQTYYYKVRARRAGGNLTPTILSGCLNLSRIKIMYAGCCLAGRKKVLAEAALSAGIKIFIGHQVVTATVAERLIDRFWDRWLQRGAIVRNVIHIYNEVVQTNPQFRRTRPVIYYRNRANQTQFWRPGMTPPDPASIKL